MNKEQLNNELLREVIDARISSITNTKDELVIKFNNEEITICSEHEQDCCENVYADFSSVEYYVKDIVCNKEVKEIVFKGIKEIGFLICFYFDWEESVKIFIPCYNSQNGYYSDKLELIVKRNNVEKKIDITEFKEDNIC